LLPKKSMRLVHGEQTARLLGDGLLTADGVCNGFQGTPHPAAAPSYSPTPMTSSSLIELSTFAISADVLPSGMIRETSGANAARSIKNIVRFPKHAADCALTNSHSQRQNSNPGYVTDLRDAIGVKDNKRVFN
jgi:hypothetical protein